MALITCHECGKEISENAQSCPQCGAPQKTANKMAKSNNNGMKKAMLILGIIGAFIAFGGAIGTLISGFASASLGALAEQGATGVIQDGVNVENESFADGAFVFWAGALSVIVATIALVSSIVGGNAKRKNIILIFALSVLISGLINIYLYNWFSGAIITISGLLGIIGSRGGEDDEKTLKQEPVTYIMLIVMATALIASIVIKNGTSLVAKTADDTNSSEQSISSNEVTPPLPVEPTIETKTASNIQSHVKYDNMECHSAWTVLNDICAHLSPENCANPVNDASIPMYAYGYLEDDKAFASACTDECYGKSNFSFYEDFEKRICK